MSTKQTKAEREQRQTDCMATLKKYLPEGSTVYTVLRHVSVSGVQRRIDLYTCIDNRLIYLTGYAEGVGLGNRPARKQGLIVKGCGMDMGYHLVYNLGEILFGDGCKLKHDWV